MKLQFLMRANVIGRCPKFLSNPTELDFGFVVLLILLVLITGCSDGYRQERQNVAEDLNSGPEIAQEPTVD